ncbi:MAG: hypothetical protein CM15mP32_2930 [Flavobacteriaceae bacterium]|nr:MAG: hypothetical protein CM15mP32_2930 [Flavobacteriaceae bacterium]
MKLKILFLFPFFISVTSLFTQEYDTPNIIYILADDMGFGDVKAYNNEAKFPTPHIDQMVRQGVKFTDAHTSSSVCTLQDMGFLLEDIVENTFKERGYAWSNRTFNRYQKNNCSSIFKNERICHCSYWKMAFGDGLALCHTQERLINLGQI